MKASSADELSNFCIYIFYVYVIDWIFPHTDRNGHIEVEELGQMISELKKATGVSNAEDEAKVESDAQCVMEILDADGNGTLEAEEFVKWVTTGLQRSQEERNEVAAMSQINRRMDNFLTSVSIMADELQLVATSPK